MKKKYTFIPFILFFFISSYGQEKHRPNKQMINSFITEVYGTINPQSQLYKNLDNLLTNRVTFVQQKEEKDEKFEKLKTIPLFNKYNASLQRDVAFTPSTFNILKYNLEFYAQYTKVYRFNSNWLLIITSQNN